MQQSFFKSPELPADVVLTPEWCAMDIVRWFKPSGSMLDPCRGMGVFHDLMPGADYCEIVEGIDFFEWLQVVDWIISNPPYSILRKWINHSFLVADNIVYLVPLKNIFSPFGLLAEIREYGGICHIRIYGTGSRVGFPMGNAVGAVHFKRNYCGPIGISYFDSIDHDGQTDG